jgi:Asp-tRNA(Asn)/Glu-tRNA(Gln) amidotransferase A subunit family amidase
MFIHTAAELMRKGQLSPLKLLDDCLARIDRYEAKVHAWVFVDREGARAMAREREAELRKGEWRGPLHGIPLGIKDIFDVADWPTAAGWQPWAKGIARRDCTVVERLRRAGAVFVGKTVTTTWASFDPPPTRNPWNLARTPGGSSSGSAAALACGMCLGAIGSQTGGSITRPASYCGVAGCKPTYGRVSCDGVVALAPSMDHPGPMARCVRDLGIILQTIAGADERDVGCADRPVPIMFPLSGETQVAPRLGRLHGLFDKRAEPVVQELMERVCQDLSSHGARVTDLALPAGYSEVIARHRTIMAVEAAAYHEQRVRRQPDEVPPKVRSLIEEGFACPAPEYQRCLEFQRELLSDTLGCFHDIVALICPATTGPAPDAATTGDPAFNSPWSLTGLPTVSFPVGKSSEGLPLSLQLVGLPWAEAELLATAAWCEAKLGFEMGEPAL